MLKKYLTDYSISQNSHRQLNIWAVYTCSGICLLYVLLIPSGKVH